VSETVKIIDLKPPKPNEIVLFREPELYAELQELLTEYQNKLDTVLGDQHSLGIVPVQCRVEILNQLLKDHRFDKEKSEEKIILSVATTVNILDLKKSIQTIQLHYQTAFNAIYEIVAEQRIFIDAGDNTEVPALKPTKTSKYRRFLYWMFRKRDS